MRTFTWHFTLVVLLVAGFPLNIQCQQQSDTKYPLRVVLYAGDDLYPMSWMNETNSVTGFDPNIAYSICNRLNRTCEWILVTNVTDRTSYLVDGKADVAIAALAVTPENAQRVQFAVPYYYFAGVTLFAPPGTIKATEAWESIVAHNKTVCTWEGSSGSAAASTIGLNTYNVVGINLTNAIADAISSKKCIGALGDNYSSKMYGLPITDLPPLNIVPFGIATANNTNLANDIGDALVDMMKSGENSEILALERQWMIVANGSQPSQTLANQVADITFLTSNSHEGIAPPPTASVTSAGRRWPSVTFLLSSSSFVFFLFFGLFSE